MLTRDSCISCWKLEFQCECLMAFAVPEARTSSSVIDVWRIRSNYGGETLRCWRGVFLRISRQLMCFRLLWLALCKQRSRLNSETANIKTFRPLNGPMLWQQWRISSKLANSIKVWPLPSQIPRNLTQIQFYLYYFTNVPTFKRIESTVKWLNCALFLL